MDAELILAIVGVNLLIGYGLEQLSEWDYARRMKKLDREAAARRAAQAKHQHTR